MRNKFASILLIFLLAGCAPQAGRACIGQACYQVEIARDDAARAKGLMFHKPLAGDEGMLFVFDREGIYPFWMKNMTFPIDIIWIGRDKKIVHIGANVPPCTEAPCASYSPGAPAFYVLEIPAGDAARKGIKPGDQVKMRGFRE